MVPQLGRTVWERKRNNPVVLQEEEQQQQQQQQQQKQQQRQQQQRRQQERQQQQQPQQRRLCKYKYKLRITTINFVLALIRTCATLCEQQDCMEHIPSLLFSCWSLLLLVILLVGRCSFWLLFLLVIAAVGLCSCW
jgi:Flp pilus assembly protein TadB